MYSHPSRILELKLVRDKLPSLKPLKYWFVAAEDNLPIIHGEWNRSGVKNRIKHKNDRVENKKPPDEAILNATAQYTTCLI